MHKGNKYDRRSYTGMNRPRGGAEFEASPCLLPSTAKAMKSGQSNAAMLEEIEAVGSPTMVCADSSADKAFGADGNELESYMWGDPYEFKAELDFAMRDKSPAGRERRKANFDDAMRRVGMGGGVVRQVGKQVAPHLWQAILKYYRGPGTQTASGGVQKLLFNAGDDVVYYSPGQRQVVVRHSNAATAAKIEQEMAKAIQKATEAGVAR